MCQSVEERISKYRPLVFQEASKWSSLLEYEDACSYGMIGLVQAAQGYSDGCKYAFASIAKRSIKARIVDGVRDEHGRTGGKRAFRQASVTLDGVIAEYLPMPGGTEASALGDIMSARLTESLAELDVTTRQVLDLRFGAGWSFRDIARLYGLDENRVEAIIRQALSKLRRSLMSQGFTSYSEAIS